MCALPSYYMKTGPDTYGYRSSSLYASYDPSGSKYSKVLSEDDFEDLGYSGSDLQSNNTSPTKTDTDGSDNKVPRIFPVEYINLDEEIMRSYYDEKYYSSYKKSDIVGAPNSYRGVKKVPCYLLTNFCIVHKFAIVELDAFGYNSIHDSGSFNNVCENPNNTSSVELEDGTSKDNLNKDNLNKDNLNKDDTSEDDIKDYRLKLRFRLMEFNNPNCVNYYTMVRQRDFANDFEKNYLLNKVVGDDNSNNTDYFGESNIEVYDLFITASEIRKSEMIHKAEQKLLDKSVNIYFTPEINSDYVSFRLRNHLKSYVLFDLRKNLVYLTGENSAASRNYETTPQIYTKKIGIY